MKNEVLTEQQKSKEDALAALQNANEDKRRAINEFQMRIQDLTTQIQLLEAKAKEDSLEQKLQLEKEHLVKSIKSFLCSIHKRKSLSFCFRIKSMN